MSIRGEYWWVYLQASRLDWVHCVAGEGLPVQQGSCTQLSDLPAPAGSTLLICVPGDRARIHKVRLPLKNRKRLLAALPFALEDQLLHEPNSYHLVPLPADRSSQQVPVVVMEHVWLSAIVETCLHSGWQVAMLVPDYLALPEPEPDTWFLDASSTPLLLRTPGLQGAVLTGVLMQDSIGTLSLVLEQAETLPQKLRVRVCDRQQYQIISSWSEPLAARDIQLDIHLEERSRTEWMAGLPQPAAAANLLTGTYSSNNHMGLSTEKYRMTMILLTALIVISGAHWLVQGSRLNTKYTQLQQSITTTYLQLFPGTRNLVDPRFQMEQQIKSLRERQQQGGAADFLSRLNQLAGQIAADPDNQVQKIDFDGNTILLIVSVANYEVLERLQARLASTGPVRVENAELKNGRVTGRIRLGGQG